MGWAGFRPSRRKRVAGTNAGVGVTPDRKLSRRARGEFWLQLEPKG